MRSTADEIIQLVVARLLADSAKPSGLQIDAFPVLDLESVDLPYLGVTLVDGDRMDQDSDTQDSLRQCSIQFEIWNKSTTAQGVADGAKTVRIWAMATLCQDESFGGHVQDIGYEGFQFAPAFQSGWLACTVMTFTFKYFWSPIP